MNPKKHKVILNEVYKESSYDQSLINDVIDFYWSNVRKCISSVYYHRINIENLGVFHLRLKRLDQTITKYYNTLNKTKTSNFNQYTKFDSIKTRIEVLEKAKKDLEKEIERRKIIKTNRYGRINTNLEEEGKDS